MKKSYEKDSFYEQQLLKKGMTMGIMQAEYRKQINDRPYPAGLKAFEKDWKYRKRKTLTKEELKDVEVA